MEREQREEFVTVREEIYDGLRFGKYIDRSNLICQYLILPAFDNPVSWDLVRINSPTSESQTRLYRSCWRMDEDYRVMSSPVERMKHPRPFRPTIEVNSAPINPTVVDALAVRFQSVRVPLAVARSLIGCDGVGFELSFGSFFYHARIGWWRDLPEEWQELQPLIAEFEMLFNLIVTARTDPGDS